MATAPSQLSPRGRLFAGGTAAATGVFILLLATGLVSSESRGADPAWLGAVMGLAFLLAGGSILLGGIGGGADADGNLSPRAPMWARVLQLLMTLAIVAALAALATWVSIGPGERQFSMSVSAGAAGPANATLGRIVFGFGALLAWGMFALFAVKGTQKLRQRGNGV